MRTANGKISLLYRKKKNNSNTSTCPKTPEQDFSFLLYIEVKKCTFAQHHQHIFYGK